MATVHKVVFVANDSLYAVAGHYDRKRDLMRQSGRSPSSLGEQRALPPPVMPLSVTTMGDL